MRYRPIEDWSDADERECGRPTDINACMLGSEVLVYGSWKVAVGLKSLGPLFIELEVEAENKIV